MPQWRDRANVGPSSELCSLFPLCDLLFRLTFYVMARFRFYRRELNVASSQATNTQISANFLLFSRWSWSSLVIAPTPFSGGSITSAIGASSEPKQSFKAGGSHLQWLAFKKSVEKRVTAVTSF